MLSQSLESCCNTAFNIARDAAETSQRLLSQMWVLIKATMDTSLSLIKLSITPYQETGPLRKRKVAGQHTTVPRGAGVGEEGEEEEPDKVN